MEPEDMYVLATNGSILSSPSPKPYPYKPPKCSDCAPLFLKVPVSCSFSVANNYSSMSSI
jgi:methylthioribulose 1-phosphate dehydratase/enolase-phosphatase E1